MKSLVFRILFAAVAAVVGAARPATAEPAEAAPPSRRALLEQALREPTRILLKDITLADAIQRIAQQTGVEIVMPADVMNLVPGGPGAVVKEINIANIPLEEGLRDLLGPLGMTLRVGEQSVEVVPKPAIRCLGRTPTWEELDLVYRLSRAEPGVDSKALEALRPSVRFPQGMADGWAQLASAIQKIGAGSGDEVLSSACAKLGWAWCPEGDQIVIAPAELAVRKCLERSISLRTRGKPLFDVIQEVGRAADVEIRIAPGALADLPVNVQRGFLLDVNGQTVTQVLESISAYTGLSYVVEPDGILIFNPTGRSSTRPSGGAVGPVSGDPYVGKVVVPLADGSSVEWLVRWSELPEDLRQMREGDLRRAFEELRRRAPESRASGQ